MEQSYDIESFVLDGNFSCDLLYIGILLTKRNILCFRNVDVCSEDVESPQVQAMGGSDSLWSV